MEEILIDKVLRSKGWYVPQIHFDLVLKEKHMMEIESINSIFNTGISYPKDIKRGDGIVV